MRVCLLLLLAACSYAYKMDVPSESMPRLRIMEVTVTTSATKIKMLYGTDQTRRIGVHPPGHDGAFRITTVDGAKSWPLKSVSGIELLPARTTVEAGESLEFTVTFEAIPNDLRRFHVGEGNYDPDSGETSWQFRDVNLRSDYPYKDAEYGQGESK